MSDVIAVSIWRGRSDGRYVDYEVPRLDSQTVLDVVTYVQRYLDPTLSYRFACRVGVCGSCAMTVNGRPRWTCRTHVGKVVDRWPARARSARQSAGHQRSGNRHDPDSSKNGSRQRGPSRLQRPETIRSRRFEPATPARVEIDKAIECINCGVCYAACDSVRWNPDYLGPAALNRAWTLVNDERDAGNPARLAAVAAVGGCHSCHTHQSCEQHCPQAINPTASIAGLKRRTLSAYWSGELT